MSKPAEDSREKQLADYNEVLAMYVMLLEEGEQDDEGQELLAEAQDQLTALATSLNAQESTYLHVTPDVVKVVLPGEDDAHPVVMYPGNAPYEVFYDQRAWYSCVLTRVIAPAESTDRAQYRAWILGYNIEEEVLGEDLRPWRGDDDLTAQLTSGVSCHAIHPRTGRYAPATVERLTLEGTVIVRWSETATSENEARASTGETTESGMQTTELPLSHVRVGKFYSTLLKRNLITEEDKQKRRRANAERKRERIRMNRHLKEDKVAQDANDWKSMMNDLAGMPEKKKRRQR